MRKIILSCSLAPSYRGNKHFTRVVIILFISLFVTGACAEVLILTCNRVSIQGCNSISGECGIVKPYTSNLTYRLKIDLLSKMAGFGLSEFANQNSTEVEIYADKFTFSLVKVGTANKIHIDYVLDRITKELTETQIRETGLPLSNYVYTCERDKVAF